MNRTGRIDRMDRAGKRRFLRVAHQDMRRMMLGSLPDKGLVFVQVQAPGDKDPPTVVWNEGERLGLRFRWWLAGRMLRLVLGRA